MWGSGLGRGSGPASERSLERLLTLLGCTGVRSRWIRRFVLGPARPVVRRDRVPVPVPKFDASTSVHPRFAGGYGRGGVKVRPVPARPVVRRDRVPVPVPKFDASTSDYIVGQFQIEGARGYGRGGSVGLSLDPRDLSFGGTAYLYRFRCSTPPRLCIRGSPGVTVEGVSRFVLYPRDLSFGGIAYLYRFRSSTPPGGPQVSGNSHASCLIILVVHIS